MTAYYNENDKYAAQWLRNLISEGLISDGEVDGRSIEDVNPGDLRGFMRCHFFAGIAGWYLALQLAGWPRAASRRGIRKSLHGLPPMTSSRQFPLSELIDEMRLLVAGREAWLEQARNGWIKRPEAVIENKAAGLERMREIGNLLVQMRQQENLKDCHGQNKNNKA